MKFWNTKLQSLSPYIPGEQPSSNSSLIKLNTNENPYPPSPKIMDRIGKDTLNNCFALYPDPLCSVLRKSIADCYFVDKDMVFCGNGSDEILNLILRSFVEPTTDTVLIPYPNYFLYEVLCQSYAIQYEYVQTVQHFNIDFNKLLKIPSKLILISNPNSPTGKLYTLQDIDYLANHYSGLIVIDEAYIDFAEKGSSAIKLLDTNDNIIILRTFSKSFSLASIRLGYAIAHKHIIAGLMRIKDSYNVSYLTQIIGNEAINDYSHMQKNVTRIINTRDYLAKELEKLGFSIIDSKANFLFCTHKNYDAKDIFLALKKKGILVRYFDRLKDYMRITIGKDEEIKNLLTELQRIITPS